jgi:hypothetical protein
VAARLIVLFAIVLGAVIVWISYHQNHKTPTVQAIDQARAEARLNHKVLMVEFEADWCSDCQSLSRSLQERDIRNYLTRHVEALHVDVGQFNRNLDIARSLGVDVNQGIPVAVFFLPEQVPASRKIGNAQILGYLHELRTEPVVVSSSPPFSRRGGCAINKRSRSSAAQTGWLVISNKKNKERCASI